MPVEELSECPSCGKPTKAVVGRCPNCGAAKTSTALTFSERYIGRGPGPDSVSRTLGALCLELAPGLGLVALGVFVFDSVWIAVLGAVILLVGPLIVRFGDFW
ncbi:MAG: hypothetical protein M3308_08705 [Actinomycetota bacterium]|nr:hypothetical protein [Actinomycetota bacterium]